MTKKSGRSLFEYLGIADQERIHTQTLAWILDPKDSPLSPSQIRCVYKKLFCTDLQPISVSTEDKNIDLVIYFEGYIIGVENKLKSRQSDSQLANYKAELGKKYKNNTLYFLTFSGEVDETARSQNLDYQSIYDVLKNIEIENTYVKDYVLLLNKMLEARKYFLSKTECCEEVFRRSGLKTELRVTDKINSESEHVLFICENRLERLFVEIYYRKIMVNSGISSDNKRVEVTENNGHALIQVHLDNLKFKVGNVDLVPGFQLQSGTIKYNICSVDYKNSKRSDLGDDFEGWLDKQFDKEIFKINSGKSKAYRSYSFSADESLLSADFEQVCAYFNCEIKKCEEKWQSIFNELAGQNNE